MRRLIRVFRAAGIQYSEDGCAVLSQALAFNAIFAVFPLVMLAVAALGFVYGSDRGQAQVLALITTVAPGVRDVVSSNLQHIVENRGLSGLLAIVALVWSGKNLFQTVAYTLDRALDIPKGRPLLKDILFAIVTLPILAVLLVVATALPLAISIVVQHGGFRHSVVWTQVAGYGTGILLVFIVTLLLYDFLPNRRMGLAFGIPGAIFTTTAWEIAQIAFGIYSTHVDYTKVYGALAALAILLLWFYYMGSIFLFGAELSAQWLEREPGERPARETVPARRTA
jgi:membrane protein